MRYLTLVALLFLLGACSSDREIQKDGTGTDEMLKSPCACTPVPYDPAAYTWIG